MSAPRRCALFRKLGPASMPSLKRLYNARSAYRPFGSTGIETIQQTKVILQSARARPWPQRAYLHISVKPNEKQDGIRHEPRLVKLEGFRGHGFVEQTACVRAYERMSHLGDEAK